MNYFFLCLPSLLFPFFLNAQTWQQLPDFPGPARDDGAAFVIGNKAYCGTGLAVGWVTTNDFYVFDMSTETWANAPSLPTGEERQYACGFSDGTKGYIFGGLDGAGNFLNDLWCFDTLAQSWTSKSFLPGAGRSGASCFVLGDSAYVIGGMTTSSTASNEVWKYRFSTDTWTQLANFPAGCWRGSAASNGVTGYSLFGRDAGNNFAGEFRVYDPGFDVWLTQNSFPAPGRAYAAMQIINGKAVVFAGIDTSQTVHGDCWTFTLSNWQWTQQPPIPSVARKGGMSFTNGIDFYYTTGIDQFNTRLAETWKLSDPTSVKEISAKTFLEIFPNPASELVTLRFPFCNKATLRVSDLSGEILQEETLAGDRFFLSLEKIPPGIYLVTLQGESRMIAQKLVVAKR